MPGPFRWRYDRGVIVEQREVTPEAFRARTGWEIRPEGLCKADRCVPLDAGERRRRRRCWPSGWDGAGARRGARAVGARARVRRPRAATAELPDDRAARPARPAVLAVVAARDEGPARRVGVLVRLPLRPARVAGTANRAAPEGLEIVTVALDVGGAEAAGPWIDRAKPEHPSLIDEAHLLDELLGVVNVPNGVWVDEQGMIVRPPEPAFPGAAVVAELRPAARGARRASSRCCSEAAKMQRRPAALRGGAARLGGQRRGQPATCSPPTRSSRARGRARRRSREAAARFELGQHLHRAGHTDDAVRVVPRGAPAPARQLDLQAPGVGVRRPVSRDRPSSTRATGSATSGRSARRTTTRRSICSVLGDAPRPATRLRARPARHRLNLAPVAAGHALFGMPMARVTIAGQRLGIFARLARGPATAQQLADELGLDPDGTMLLLDSLAALEHVDKRATGTRSPRAGASGSTPPPTITSARTSSTARLLGAGGTGSRRSCAPARASRSTTSRPTTLLGEVHPRAVRAGAHQLTRGGEGAAPAGPAESCSTSRAGTAGTRRSCAAATRACTRRCSTCRAAPRSGGASSPSRDERPRASTSRAT